MIAVLKPALIDLESLTDKAEGDRAQARKLCSVRDLGEWGLVIGKRKSEQDRNILMVG